MIRAELVPVADAMIENLQRKAPNSIVFVVGNKHYKAKDVIKEIKKGSNFAEGLITDAVKANSPRIDKFTTFSIETISMEIIEATVEMFKNGR